MRFTLFSILMIPCFLFNAFAAPAQTPEEGEEAPASEPTPHPAAEPLRTAVLDAVGAAEEELDIRIGLSLHDPRTGIKVEHNADTLFHPASTMKLAVMIEVFRQADQGHFALDDGIVVDPVCYSMLDGSEFICDTRAYLGERIGEEVPVRKLVEQMMVVSDNLATNLLIQLVSAQRITATMRELGAMDGFVIRGLQDIPAYEAGISNRFTPNDLTILLEAVQTGRAASPEGCSEMRQILRAQEYGDQIPALLPEGVQVGHKTGGITGHRHDTAIVYAPFGPYYLTILIDNIGRGVDATSVAPELSRLIYDLLEDVSLADAGQGQ